MRKMMTGKKKLKKLTRTSDRGRERKRKAFAARVLGFSFEDLVLGARSSAHKPRERERRRPRKDDHICSRDQEEGKKGDISVWKDLFAISSEEQATGMQAAREDRRSC